jgi:hypothetical protein
MIRRATKTFKLILAVLITLLIFCAIFLSSLWKSPEANKLGQWCLHPENVDFNKDKPDLELELHSSSGAIFKVKQIKNSPKQSINPYFPVILIEPNVKVDGWIHIVYTDATKYAHLGCHTFVDHDPKWTNDPFYSYLPYFYDAPLWTYSLFNKPLNFWKGHAFAVKVDHQKKSIHCMGGIEWGFKLSHFRLRPKATTPQLLNKNDWEKAWTILQKKMIEYHQTYEAKP